ncbi:MAG: protein kinase [Steroidobacteraceae bacterium]|nr:protein kinase [Steroidobacteraceae bacterium]
MTQPFLRSLTVAFGFVAALAGLAHSAAEGLEARLEGALLAVVQSAADTPVTAPVTWLDTGGGEGDATRGELAVAIERLRRDGATTVVIARPLEQPSGSPDLTRVRAFLDGPESTTDPATRARLQAWAAELDHDARLEQAIAAAGNVVLRARPDADPPLERLARRASAVGVDPTQAPDADGVYRRESLVVGAERRPSLAYAAATAAQARAVTTGERVTASLPVQTGFRVNPDGAWVPYYGRRAGTPGGLERQRFSDYTAGRVPPLAVAGRIVVIGSSRDAVPVPTAAAMPAAEALALRIASLVEGRYAIVPVWAPWASIALLLLAAPWAAWLGSGVRPGAAIALTLLAAFLLLAIEVVLLAQGGLWLPMVVPAAAFVLATVATTLVASRAPDGASRRAAAPPMRPAGTARPAFVAERERRPPPDTAPPEQTAPLAPDRGTPGPEHAGRNGTAAGAPAPPTSLREISDALRARAEEPSRADVADLLLGRVKRPPKPRLGRYELERELGRGAMGTVYLGRDPHINRVVAIKALPIAEEFEEQDLAEARARFFREAEMAGRLSHPGIVTVYDAGEDGAVAWIAMEYVQGRMLSEHAVSDRLLPAAHVLEIVARIADALDYAHRQDVVHRDVKPANVIVDPQNLDAKITDFGIARLTNSSATRTGIVLGTPSFMAPEQLEGRFVTGRSDLFSLGVTLFQLLAGLLPFRADSMTGLMDKIANAPHPPLRTIRPDLPPCVGLIVDKALAKDPADRYATAADMARALRACARSLKA